MKIIFDPEIPEDLREDIKATVEEEGLEEKCPQCGTKEVYVALLQRILDVKCYECGYSYAEIEIEED